MLSELTGPVAEPQDGSTRQAQLVAEHWAGRLPTFDEALARLRTKGVDTNSAIAQDLHLFDMVHMGGVEATDMLAGKAGITNGIRVLDAGCGLGGPARHFASKYGADVSGIELTEPVYRTAVALTKLVGLEDRVKLTRGSVLSMPYKDQEFDVVVMQHCAMHVGEKRTMFGECGRVLRPGGVLALHEIFSGAGGEPYYPLPWATQPAMSSLETLDDTKLLLRELGFAVGPFLDLSEAGKAYHEKIITDLEMAMVQETGDRGKGTQPGGLSSQVSQGMVKNFAEDRVRVGIIVCQKSVT